MGSCWCGWQPMLEEEKKNISMRDNTRQCPTIDFQHDSRSIYKALQNILCLGAKRTPIKVVTGHKCALWDPTIMRVSKGRVKHPTTNHAMPCMSSSLYNGLANYWFIIWLMSQIYSQFPCGRVKRFLKNNTQNKMRVGAKGWLLSPNSRSQVTNSLSYF